MRQEQDIADKKVEWIKVFSDKPWLGEEGKKRKAIAAPKRW